MVPSSEYYYVKDRTHAREGLSYECKKCCKERNQKRYWSNPQHKAEISRYYRYRLTQEQYEKMLKEQEGRCKLCRAAVPLVVDHHCYRGVRGLLCSHCNRGLGFLRHNPLVLRKAIAYLGFEV